MDGNPTAVWTHLVGRSSLLPKTSCFILAISACHMFSYEWPPSDALTYTFTVPTIALNSSIKRALCVFYKKAYWVVTIAFMLRLLAVSHMTWVLGPLPSSSLPLTPCQIVRVIWKWRSEQRFIMACLLPWNRWHLGLGCFSTLSPSVSSCRPLNFLELKSFTGGPSLYFFPCCPLVGWGLPLLVMLLLLMPFLLKFPSIVSSPVLCGLKVSNTSSAL